MSTIGLFAFVINTVSLKTIMAVRKSRIKTCRTLSTLSWMNLLHFYWARMIKDCWDSYVKSEFDLNSQVVPLYLSDFLHPQHTQPTPEVSQLAASKNFPIQAEAKMGINVFCCSSKTMGWFATAYPHCLVLKSFIKPAFFLWLLTSHCLLLILIAHDVIISVVDSVFIEF